MPKSHGLPGLRRVRYHSPLPAGRLAPFVFMREEGGGPAGVLIAPFPKRRGGPTAEEAALVEAVAGRLAGGCRPALPAGVAWVDPASGAATPAALGEGQLRRRLADNASFNVRVRADSG